MSRQRRNKRLRTKKGCPRCLNLGYDTTKAQDGRPQFKCQRCRHEWTSGKDGGEYMKSSPARVTI